MSGLPIWAMSSGPLMTSMSLSEYAAWLRANGIIRIRIDFANTEVRFYCGDRSYFTTVLCGLAGVKTARRFAPADILQALDRAWLQRISVEQFLIRIARAGCAFSSFYLRPDLLVFESHEGRLITRPIFFNPVA